MSKLKTPREKKLASLALDCRNVYGEDTKASRKGVPLRKQLSHQELRRAAKAPLASLVTAADEDALMSVEAEIRAKEVKAVRGRFRKRPDEALGAVLEAKTTDDRSKLIRKRK